MKIGTTLANFNSLGNKPSSIDLLMRYVNGFTYKFEHIFSRKAGISSQPGLLFFKEMIICLTSVVVVGAI